MAKLKGGRCGVGAGKGLVVKQISEFIEKRPNQNPPPQTAETVLANSTDPLLPLRKEWLEAGGGAVGSQAWLSGQVSAGYQQP